MKKWLDNLTERILNGGEIEKQEAIKLLEIKDQPDVISLLSCANIIRHRFRGNKISLCSVVNAKSGICPENCKFCSQSAYYNTSVQEFPLMQPKEIIDSAKKACSMGANCFGVVTSGKGIQNKRELDNICKSIRGLSDEVNIERSASLGTLDKKTAVLLKEAGLQSYNHNLETSEGFFSKICTTHTYKERLNTIKTAKDVGFNVCCGGVFGLGENTNDRVEFAFTLKELNIDMVPLNFLNPIQGTPLENMIPLKPLEILKIIALFRFTLPQKDIKVCGGREKSLKSLQPLMYIAGASGTMLGDYLTTKGRNWQEDIQEILDLELQPTQLD